MRPAKPCCWVEAPRLRAQPSHMDGVTIPPQSSHPSLFMLYSFYPRTFLHSVLLFLNAFLFANIFCTCMVIILIYLSWFRRPLEAWERSPLPLQGFSSPLNTVHPCVAHPSCSPTLNPHSNFPPAHIVRANVSQVSTLAILTVTPSHRYYPVLTYRWNQDSKRLQIFFKHTAVKSGAENQISAAWLPKPKVRVSVLASPSGTWLFLPHLFLYPSILENLTNLQCLNSHCTISKSPSQIWLSFSFFLCSFHSVYIIYSTTWTLFLIKYDSSMIFFFF